LLFRLFPNPLLQTSGYLEEFLHAASLSTPDLAKQ
jgi:hypothetical protein